MAGAERAAVRVCGRIVRYATVVLGVLFFSAPAIAQQSPDPPAEVQPGWDTQTAPAKGAKAAGKAKDQKGAGLPAAAGKTIVLPAPSTKPEGTAAAAYDAPPPVTTVKRVHKGDPVVLQSDLPPAVSYIVTGAIGAAGDAKVDAAKEGAAPEGTGGAKTDEVGKAPAEIGRAHV